MGVAVGLVILGVAGNDKAADHSDGERGANATQSPLAKTLPTGNLQQELVHRHRRKTSRKVPNGSCYVDLLNLHRDPRKQWGRGPPVPDTTPCSNSAATTAAATTTPRPPALFTHHARAHQCLAFATRCRRTRQVAEGRSPQESCRLAVAACCHC